jgi:RNA polymerase sigma-70 factor (ECF subfamily)
MNLSGEAGLDESALVHNAANGDAAAWESLVGVHQDAVFRLAYLLLGDPDDAMDVAQESFLRAWRHLHSFNASRPLRPWLLSICANLARNRRRSAGRYFAALLRAFRDEPVSERIEEQTARNFQARELWKAVQKLNVLDQQIVYLRYFLDLPVAETAEILKVAEGTVKSRLSRALEKLRDIIRQDFPLLSEERET